MYMEVFAVLFSVIVVGILGQTVEQPELSWTKSQNKRARISCIVTGLQSDNYVHWYQQKDGEALKRILYVNKDGTNPVHNADLHEATDFTVQLENDNYALRVRELKPSHSGVYYCAWWDMSSVDYKVFGSGTRLIVTENQPTIKEPTLLAYPIVKQNNGKRVLLCQARDMAPNLVRFKWKEGSTNVNSDLVEQNDGSVVTSMLIVDEDKARTNQYTCSVQHESSNNDDKETIIPKEDDKPPKTERATVASPTCSPSPGQKEEERTNFASSELMHRLYLFNLTYVSLLVKNVLYFCAVGVLLYKRRAGNSETFSKPSPTSN